MKNKPPLTTAEQVMAAFPEKQWRRWVLVGYRQWWKRRNAQPTTRGKVVAANKDLRALSKEKLAKLRERLRKKVLEE